LQGRLAAGVAAMCKKTYKKILVIRVLGIGEAVMFGPTLKCLRQNYPDAEIHLMTGKLLGGFFLDSALVDKTVEVDEGRLLSKDPLFVLGLARRLRKANYDLVICAHPHILYSVLVRMLGVRETIGFDWNGRGFLYRHRLKPKRVARPRQFLRLLEPLGLEGDPRTFPFCRGEQLREAQVFMDDLKKGDDLIVGMCIGGAKNPGVDFTQKRWPLDNYIALAEMLIRNEKARILLFGGHTDAEEGRIVQTRLGDNVYSAIGRFDIAGTQAVMSLCDLIVAHDCGPLHLAVASGCPVFGIYGATRPETCYDSGELTVIRGQTHCSPCCPEYPDEYPFDIPAECKEKVTCMAMVQPELVYENILTFMNAQNIPHG